MDWKNQNYSRAIWKSINDRNRNFIREFIESALKNKPCRLRRHYFANSEVGPGTIEHYSFWTSALLWLKRYYVLVELARTYPAEFSHNSTKYLFNIDPSQSSFFKLICNGKKIISDMGYDGITEILSSVCQPRYVRKWLDTKTTLLAKPCSTVSYLSTGTARNYLRLGSSCVNSCKSTTLSKTSQE